MIEVKMTKEMTALLRAMVGQMFCSYEYENAIADEAYGNLRINLESFAVEILNEVKEFPFFHSTEDISCFSLHKKLPNEPFVPYCNGAVKVLNVNEKILSIYTINDEVSVNDGEYDISLDMAIIIETSEHKYVFSRGWFFSEVIDIHTDKEFDEIYSVDKVVEDWSNEGNDKVKVRRTTRKL